MPKLEPRDRARSVALAASWAGVLLLLALAAGAQEIRSQEVRQRTEARYEVLPVRGGVVLRPREESAVESIEVREGEVAVDGHRVTEEELQRILGHEHAETVLDLATHSEAQLRTLFDLPPRPPAPPPAPQAPSAPADAEDPADALEREITKRVEREMRRVEERAQRAERRARARSGGGGARVIVGSAIHVEANEVSGDVVALGGSVVIDGEVLGDAVAIGGPVRVTGQVTGDVVSVGGGVRLASTAEVGGSVVSVGGRLEREPGARIAGEVTEVNLLGGLFVPWRGRSWDWEWRWDRLDYFRGAVTELLGNVTRLLVVALLGALLLVVARDPVERAAARIRAEPLKAFGVGFGALVLFVPVLVLVSLLLLISIIGIPLLLLVPFAAVALVAIAFFGYVSAAYALGRWSERRFGWQLAGPVVVFLVGVAILHGWGLTADLIDVADGPRDVLVFLVMVFGLFGFFLKLGAWSAGLGGVILGWRRAGETGVSGAGAPPPAGMGLTGSPPPPEPGPGQPPEPPEPPKPPERNPPTAAAATEEPDGTAGWEEPWPRGSSEASGEPAAAGEQEERWPEAELPDEPSGKP
jgi:hypothetical protein